MTGAAPPIIVVHPTEPSACASSAMTRICAVRSSSAPLWLCGTSIRKHPASVSASTKSGGTRRACSISSPRDGDVRASSRTASRIPLVSLTMGPFV